MLTSSKEAQTYIHKNTHYFFCISYRYHIHTRFGMITIKSFGRMMANAEYNIAHLCFWVKFGHMPDNIHEECYG